MTAAAEAKENISHRDFIHQGSKFMLLDNASKVLDPLLVLLCARLYVGGEWGFFKYYESILLLLMRLAVAGMDRGVVWIYAQRGTDESFLRVFSRAVNFVMLFAAALALLAAAQWAGWIPAWGRFAHGAAGSSWLNIICYLASLPFQAAMLLFLQALTNKRALYAFALIRNMAVPVATLGPAALLAFTPLKPHGLALPYLFGSVLGFVLSAVFFARAYPSVARSWAPSAWVPRDLMRYSLPLASTDFVMSFAYRIDILLLGRYAGLGVVEVYAVIVMISNALLAIKQSFDNILLSVFSKKVPGQLPDNEYRYGFNYATWLIFSVRIPFFFLACFFGREFLYLISPVYGTGYATLIIATAFILFATPFTLASIMLMGLGKTKVIPVSQALFFVLTLGLNMWLIPSHGMAGAAVAMGLSTVITSLFCMAALRYYEKTWYLQASYLWHAFIETLFFAPSLVLYAWLKPALPVTVLLFLAGALAYAAYAWKIWKRLRAHA